MRAGDVDVLDVRGRAEWEAGHLPESGIGAQGHPTTLEEVAAAGHGFLGVEIVVRYPAP